MRWWRLPGGCFFRGSFLDAEGLPAFEKILPGVGTGESLFVIAQVESRWIERWLYVRPLERHGERRLLAASNRIRRNHGGAEGIAERIQIHALAASLNALLRGELLGMIGSHSLADLLGEGQHFVIRRPQAKGNEDMQAAAAGGFRE